MVKFLKGSTLNAALEKIIKDFKYKIIFTYFKTLEVLC